MTHRPLALAGALATLATAPLAAQAPDSTAACANVFAGGTMVVDSLVLVATPGYKLEDVADPGMKNLAIGIATSLELPTPLALPPVVNLWHRNGAVMGVPVNPSQGFAAEALLEIDRDGAVTKVALSQTSLAAALDSALLNAVISGTALGLPPQLTAAARRAGGGVVFVSLQSIPGQPPASRFANQPHIGWVPVAGLRAPTVALTSEPSGHFRVPEYPEALQREGIEGRTVAVFVIGTDGTMIPGTLSVTGTSREFLLTSGDAVSKAHFTPAMVGKCPVAALVVQPFSFRIR